jgi:diguanylate cyclase (GGDEF)-like protein
MPLASKHRHLLSILTLMLAFCCTSASADDNVRADELLEMFDRGDNISIEEQASYIKELESLIDKNDVKRQEKLIAIQCWTFDNSKPGQGEQAIVFANARLGEIANPSQSNLAIDLKLCRSYFQQEEGDVDQAMQGYDSAVAEAYKLENPRLIADARSLRGALYSFQGNFAKALDDLITSQHLYENLGLDYWALQNLRDLATSYRRFGDPTSAIRYYDELEQAFKKSGDTLGAIATNFDIALALNELGDHEQALARFLASYEFARKKDDKFSMAVVSVNIAGTLLKLNRPAEAMPYLKAATLEIKPKDHGFYSFMKLYFAQAHLMQNQANEALPYIGDAEQSFQHNKNTRGMAELLWLKAEVYSTMQRWQEAFQALMGYTDLRNELDKNMQTQRTSEMRARFDSQRIEEENQRLMENQRLRDHELLILEQNKILQMIVIVLALIILITVSIFAYKQVNKSKLLEKLALTDHLTQLPNRRHTYVKGEQHFKEAKKNNQPLSVILFDADHFKKINDNFGHETGDKVLIELANTSAGLMRKDDLVGRVGGEEFLVILPDTSAQQAQVIADRLVVTIANRNLAHIKGSVSVTISAGVASLQQDGDLSSLLKRADHALYEAKLAGRNCIKFATDSPKSNPHASATHWMI